MKTYLTVLSLLVLLSSNQAVIANDLIYEQGGKEVCNSKNGTISVTYRSSGLLSIFSRSKLSFNDSNVGSFNYSDSGFLPVDYNLNIFDLNLYREIEDTMKGKDHWASIIFSNDGVVVIRADIYKTSNETRSFSKSEYFVVRDDVALSHFKNCK